MRAMRRQDRAVTDAETIAAVIAATDRCRLGFCDRGRPYVVPVNFGHTVEAGKDVFYFHGAREGRKADLIRETGWTCLQLDSGYRLYGEENAACTYAAAFVSVIAEGPIAEVTDRAEKLRGLNAVMAQATGKGEWTYDEAALRGVCLWRMEAETLTCKEHL